MNNNTKKCLKELIKLVFIELQILQRTNKAALFYSVTLFRITFMKRVGDNCGTIALERICNSYGVTLFLRKSAHANDKL